MYCEYNIIDIADISGSDIDYCRRMMSDTRRQRVDRLRFEKSRRQTVGGELLARRMIASRCGIAPESISFSLTELGKPYAAELPVEFSISHSGDFVLCALSDHPVGADIERIRDVSDRLVSYVCSEDEMRFLSENGILEDERKRRFFRVWTAKEAYYKYIGTGITCLRDVNTLAPDFQRKLKWFYYGGYAVSIFGDSVLSLKKKNRRVGGGYEEK